MAEDGKEEYDNFQKSFRLMFVPSCLDDVEDNLLEGSLGCFHALATNRDGRTLRLSRREPFDRVR